MSNTLHKHKSRPINFVRLQKKDDVPVKFGSEYDEQASVDLHVLIQHILVQLLLPTALNDLTLGMRQLVQVGQT